ncbi:MAG: lasso peptide biosynthesis B2 protein [Sciscionella sp.]
MASAVARLVLRVFGFHRVTQVVRHLTRTTRCPASATDVLTALRTVDMGARWLPCRVACLERTLAAVLLLAIRRRGVSWNVGVHTPPFTMHAWLTDGNGQTVGEPAGTVAYRPLVVISPSYPKNRSTT